MLRPAVLSAALCLLPVCSGCSFCNHVQLDPIATSFQNKPGYSH